jgi:predicted TIM-barrel fold metal-dependent hydrolase
MIIDCQVNYGNSLFGPNCDILYYDKKAQERGITHALVMPTLTHELKKRGLKEKSCIWEKSKDKIIYKNIIQLGGREKETINPQNPYKLMNKECSKKIDELNNNSKIQYFFIPKIHPFLDTSKEIESLLSNSQVKGLKLNGLASHVSPEDIPSWLPDLIKKYDKPLMVHTDYLNPNYDISQIPPHLREIIKKNNPLSWLKWIEKNDSFKTYLAHLARFDKRAIEKINYLDNIIIGMGPDLMLQTESARLKEPTSNILQDILRIINPDRLVFSTDFAWNVHTRENWESFDWESVSRLKKEAKKQRINQKDLEKILGENALRFFNLSK